MLMSKLAKPMSQACCQGTRVLQLKSVVVVCSVIPPHTTVFRSAQCPSSPTPVVFFFVFVLYFVLLGVSAVQNHTSAFSTVVAGGYGGGRSGFVFRPRRPLFGRGSSGLGGHSSGCCCDSADLAPFFMVLVSLHVFLFCFCSVGWCGVLDLAMGRSCGGGRR
ncbi:hypothetical protein L195_g046400 [Trifolium pratense]|uniref:Uncharacterized protein n=1 Tax=Trifolium pratense TaxID=57577 RepID=A0A2K3MHL5_TRIPR|nr:hypothetical protein L195_g046400 [Trifolium pratense]